MRFIILFLLLCIPGTSFAHPGRLNAEGCHNNKASGKYECHGVTTKPAKKEAKVKARTKARDYNCIDFSTQKEAQAAFKMAGGPAIDTYDLDRDSDGIACEELK
jgi:hypothetical protein